MPICCVVFGCRSIQSPSTKLGFYRFPTDEYYKKQWIKAVRRKNWLPTKFSSVCSNHFSEDMFDCSKKEVKLKPFAVPNIFAYQSLQQQVMSRPVHKGIAKKSCKRTPQALRNIEENFYINNDAVSCYNVANCAQNNNDQNVQLSKDVKNMAMDSSDTVDSFMAEFEVTPKAIAESMLSSVDSPSGNEIEGILNESDERNLFSSIDATNPNKSEENMFLSTDASNPNKTEENLSSMVFRILNKSEHEDLEDKIEALKLENKKYEKIIKAYRQKMRRSIKRISSLENSINDYRKSNVIDDKVLQILNEVPALDNNIIRLLACISEDQMLEDASVANTNISEASNIENCETVYLSD